MNKPMNIPQEFEEYLQGVELTEDEIGFFNWIVRMGLPDGEKIYSLCSGSFEK